MNVIGVGFPARSQSKFVSLIFLGPLHNLAKVASFFLGKNVRGPFWHSSIRLVFILAVGKKVPSFHDYHLGGNVILPNHHLEVEPS